MRKKHLAIMMAMAFSASLLSGCSSNQTPGNGNEDNTTVVTEEASESSTTETDNLGKDSEDNTQSEAEQSKAEEDSEPEGDASTYYMNVAYKDVITKYKSAITEKWDYGKCVEEDICPLITNAGATSLSDIGVAFVDMDHDGYYELIIGDPNDTTGKSVYEVWTYDGNKATKLITAQERCLVNVGYWNEDDVYYIATMGSNSAVEYEYDYYTIMNGALNNIQSIISEAVSETETKWYQADSESGDRSEIEEQLANDIVDANQSTLILPDYIPLG